MKLVFGLGNPGPEYRFSPHNLGFEVVGLLAERNAVRLTRKQGRSLCARFLKESIAGASEEPEEVWLIQPQTFMNRSGTAVKDWLGAQGCSHRDLLVIADELDLPWGSLRIRTKGGAAGHHGLESIIDSIGSQDFTRLRIGVAPEHKVADPVRYLLTPLRGSLRQSAETVVSLAAEAVEVLLREGPASAMNQYNRRGSASDAPAAT